MKTEIARKAAKWWADQLRGNAKLDNGDNSETGAFTLVAAAMLQSKEKSKITPKAIDKFEDELAKAIEKEEPWVISVDYHPDMILRKSAEKAGLPLGMTTLPWKTTMWVKDDSVTVRCGYGADEETL